MHLDWDLTFGWRKGKLTVTSGGCQKAPEAVQIESQQEMKVGKALAKELASVQVEGKGKDRSTVLRTRQPRLSSEH